jgi:hypothetical protein
LFSLGSRRIVRWRNASGDDGDRPRKIAKIQAALDRHRAASDANDCKEEDRIYREGAVVEYLQSGERIRRPSRQSARSHASQPTNQRKTIIRQV